MEMINELHKLVSGSRKKYFHGLIILILFIVWLVITFSIIFEKSITILEYSYPSKNISQQELRQGIIVSGSFIAKDNYMGTVGVRFETYQRDSDDQLYFRIKESSQKDWYYTGLYNTDQFQNSQFFPFGFPVIKNSQGVEYIFELESVRGSDENFVSVSTMLPKVQSLHQYPKESITSSFSSMVLFALYKIGNLFLNVNFVLKSLLSLFPLLLYVSFILKPGLYKRSYPKNEVINLLDLAKKYPFLSIFIIFLYIIIFFLNTEINAFLLIIILTALGISLLYKLGSKGLFVLAFMMLLVCPFLVFLKFVKPGETAALLAFCFLLGGTLLSFKELHNK